MNCSVTWLSSLGFTDPGMCGIEGQTLCLLCVGRTCGEGWKEDPLVVAEGLCPVTGQLAAQTHLPVSDLTIWRQEKIERDNLGHLQHGNLETGKHKPLVLEQTVVQRRWHLPKTVQVKSVGLVPISVGLRGENLMKMGKLMQTIDQIPLRGKPP